jgi:hypothetical protein
MPDRNLVRRKKSEGLAFFPDISLLSLIFAGLVSRKRRGIYHSTKQVKSTPARLILSMTALELDTP